MSETLEIPLDKLITPYFNPRNHPQEQVYNLSLSLKEFGQRRTIAAWPVGDGTYEVLAGNGIKQAAEMAGWSKLTCTLAPKDMTTLQRKAYALADNQGGAIDDMTKVAQILEEVSADGRIALEALGSSQAGLDALLEDLANQALQGQEPGNGGDEFDTTQNVPERSKLGDIWELGAHKIAVIDSTNIVNVRAFLGGIQPSVVIADPPYGINLDTDLSSIKTELKGWKGQGGKYQPIIGDDVPFDPSFILNTFNQCKEIFLWGADYYAERLTNKNEGSWIVWDKRVNEDTGAELSWGLGSEFELCWSKNKHQRQVFRKMWSGLYGTESQDVRKRVHPTQKPVELYSWLLTKFSVVGNVVFDPFLGSGSVVIAAEKLGDRSIYGCELDPKYADIVIFRWEKETNQQAILSQNVYEPGRSLNLV